MSTFIDRAIGARMSIETGWPTRLRKAVKRWWDAECRRREDCRAAAHLRSWSDRQLKDIGIGRGQIEFAVRGLDIRGASSRGRPSR